MEEERNYGPSFYDDEETKVPKPSGIRTFIQSIKIFGGVLLLFALIVGGGLLAYNYLTGNQILNAYNKSLNASGYGEAAYLWGNEFFHNVSVIRDSQYTYCPPLGAFAQTRFYTLSSNYQISHYNYSHDVAAAGYQSYLLEEEYFHPPLVTPPGAYAASLAEQAPLHWQGLINRNYSYFGFYWGTAKAVGVAPNGSKPSCSTGGYEITGPNVNITQFLQQKGCATDVYNTTYFVVELANKCP